MNRRGTVGTLPLSWDVLLDTPVVAQSAPSVLGQYDIVLLDQFGVLHDGKRPSPGAVECVEALLSAGKGVVVCSNSSQRKELALSRWVNMGFPGDVGFLTSGEVSFQHLKKMLKRAVRVPQGGAGADRGGRRIDRRRHQLLGGHPARPPGHGGRGWLCG